MNISTNILELAFEKWINDQIFLGEGFFGKSKTIDKTVTLECMIDRNKV